MRNPGIWKLSRNDDIIPAPLSGRLDSVPGCSSAVFAPANESKQNDTGATLIGRRRRRPCGHKVAICFPVWTEKAMKVDGGWRR
jgi:hypothetical protein